MLILWRNKMKNKDNSLKDLTPQKITVSLKDFLKILALIENPPHPTKALKDLIKENKKDLNSVELMEWAWNKFYAQYGIHKNAMEEDY